MLRRDAIKSMSFRDGFKARNFFHLGRGFLPLLAVLLLATPQLAFAQDSLLVTVNPRTLDIDERGLDNTGMYRVQLDAAPSENVVITVAGGTGVVTVSPPSVTLDSDNWQAGDEFTVTGVDDPDAVDQTVTLTHTATVGDDEDEVTLKRASVTVTVRDLDEQVVVIVADDPEVVPEAGSGTYTIRLQTQPTAMVTVDVGGASGEITVSPSRLFFTPDNYNTEQTVTVFAGVDFDAEDDEATLTHTVRGADYTGVKADTVAVMVNDPDEPGVTVSPTSLNIAAGQTETYKVMLNTQPTRSVYVTVTDDSDDVAVNSSSNYTGNEARLTFSTSTWNRPQNVTVRVRSGATGSASLTHAVEKTSDRRDKAYDDVTIAEVDVSIAADRPTAVRLSRTSTLSIREGQSSTYTVRMSSTPTSSVTVNVASDNPDVSVEPDETLTFDADDNEAKTVTVTALEDEDGETDTAIITHTVSGEDVVSRRLPVSVTDNDPRGVTVTPTSLEVAEGASDSYTVVLDTEPTDTVTVTVTGAEDDVTVRPSQLTFEVDNNQNIAWFIARKVTVEAAQDPDGEPDDPVTLRHTVRGGDYERNRVTAANVRVTIQEDEKREIIVDTHDGQDDMTLTNTWMEPIPEGETRTYSVKLASRPTGTVTVMVQGDLGDVIVKPRRLTFTTSNFDTAQTVEVKVGQDADGVDDAAVTLTHVASGGGYNGVTGGIVTVPSTDDDEPGVTVTPRALTVTEGGPASAYTVVLNTEPRGMVTITLGGLDDADAQSLVVSRKPLTFDERTWNIPQEVSVRAAEDDDGTAVPVTLTHTVSGGGYGGLTALPVMVTIRENDIVGLTVTPERLEITQGTRRTYTVALNTRPATDVAVAISAQGTGVTASPRSLDFTAANWSKSNAKEVTVHVAPDATAEDSTISNTASGANSGYDGEVKSVAVVVKDKDAAGVNVNPTSLTVTEGGSASYSVVLTKAPTKSVRVDISGDDADNDVSVSPRGLTFSTSNWNRDQTVRVSLAEDDDQVRDVPVTLRHEVTSDDEAYENLGSNEVEEVTVTFMENDMRGVTIAPTSLTIAAGMSGTYRVRLNTEPLDDVTVTVTSPRDDVTVSDPLVFTTGNWRTQQTVTVMVTEDAGDEEMQTVVLEHTVTGGDYTGVGVSEGAVNVIVTIPVEGAPSAPRGLSATGSDQSVTLSWSAPASDGGSAILRYQYRYQQTGRGFTDWATVPGGASATSYAVTGLENGTSYTFEVRAVNSIGGGQGATASATLAESAPGAPAALTATGGDEQVALSWDAPADGGSQIIRYEYRYAASGETWSEWMTASGGGSARSATISGLTNGTLYGFQVRAVNGIGEGPHAEASATPGRAPSAPTGLTARSESETITVMWGVPADDGGSAITGYQIRYRMEDGQWTNWMAVDGGASAMSYTIMGLTNGIGYDIEVRAVNSVDAGDAAMTRATPMEALVFAHFANGKSGEMTNISDLVLVNVETSAVNVAIYFYGKDGGMIPADSLVDMTGDMEPTGDGGVTVDIVGQGEMTVSTNGEGEFKTGSVKASATGRIGGVLRFDISMIGVAGVGASAPVSDAIFPVRRIEGGINTGVAIRNLESEPTDVTCHLMKGGRMLSGPGESGRFPAGGQTALFIHQMFKTVDTSDFSGSVRCMVADGGMFTAVALEMDGANQIFTTLPVVPVDEEAADDGESMLNFAHFANGDFGGFPISSDLVFVNVANTSVAPVIYFYDRDGNMIDADTVVDAMMEGIDFRDDGALTVMDEIPPLGEMTISTTGMGDDVVGSVRVVSDGPIGGVLRFVTSNIGVAGVGASEAVNAAIFPARYMENGINTGAAIRNLESEKMTVTCKLMQGGQMEAEKPIKLEGNAQNSQFITEVFEEAFMAPGMSEFEGSVHCAAPEGMMFTGVALEMDFNNGIFTTLPVVPVQ